MDEPAPGHRVVRRLLLGGIGLCDALAFASLGVQVRGLIGAHGILPNARWFQALSEHIDVGFADAPSLCWGSGCSDALLLALCWGGAAAGLALAAGVLPWLSALICFASYLSLVSAGQVFLSYQWDTLLLEAGFLALLLAPPGAMLPHSAAWRHEPPRVALWLVRWLLFRLVWCSGVVKLASGDPTWRDLTALAHHYETQPLPTWTSWWAFQLPLGFQRASTALTLAVELLAPLGYFGPRRVRFAAGAATAGLMLGIAATGNYGFFNLLAIVLCISLLDDAALPRRWRAGPGLPPSRPHAFAVLGVAVPLALASAAPVIWAVGAGGRAFEALARLYELQRGFHVTSSYGLFAVMTTERPELRVEGSRDGETWTPYAFRWKPGDPQRAPRFAGPHMPRLDWQLWFAALEGPDRVRWLQPFLSRLLQGRPEVLDLMAGDPFAGRPPRFVRIAVDDYHFTTRAERAESGAWWRVVPGRVAIEVRRDESEDP
jgi:hypothetical protein